MPLVDELRKLLIEQNKDEEEWTRFSNIQKEALNCMAALQTKMSENRQKRWNLEVKIGRGAE